MNLIKVTGTNAKKLGKARYFSKPTPNHFDTIRFHSSISIEWNQIWYNLFANQKSYSWKTVFSKFINFSTITFLFWKEIILNLTSFDRARKEESNVIKMVGGRFRKSFSFNLFCHSNWGILRDNFLINAFWRQFLDFNFGVIFCVHSKKVNLWYVCIPVSGALKNYIIHTPPKITTTYAVCLFVWPQKVGFRKIKKKNFFVIFQRSFSGGISRSILDFWTVPGRE